MNLLKKSHFDEKSPLNIRQLQRQKSQLGNLRRLLIYYYCASVYNISTIKPMTERIIRDRTRHPAHPAIPLQQKTRKEAIACNPQPESPRITINMIAIMMIRRV